MEEMDDEMAVTMGFSSFSNTSKTNTKKRKFDTNAPNSQLDASGANATKLGVRQKTTAEGKTESEPADTTSKTHAAPEPIEAAQATATAPSEEPHQPASSTPDANAQAKGKKKGKKPAASGLADFLAHGRTLPEKPPAASATPDPPCESEKPGDKQVTQMNPPAADMVSFGGTPISRSELRALRRGVRGANGKRTFFKPSFVVGDPWAKFKSRV